MNKKCGLFSLFFTVAVRFVCVVKKFRIRTFKSEINMHMSCKSIADDWRLLYNASKVPERIALITL